MATEDETGRITAEDARSVARKWEAWVAELTPGERDALAAALRGQAREGDQDDVQGFFFSVLGGFTGQTSISHSYVCTCPPIGINPSCVIHGYNTKGLSGGPGEH